MKITPDTNVLLRAAVYDEQGPTARAALAEADTIALPLSTLCEFVWVLRSTYKRPAQEVSASIVALIAGGNVETNQAAVRAGLDILLAGGDFADGVIAYEGSSLGGDTFVTFDRKAAKLVEKLNLPSLLLE
ncbi:type II toxin-antitoxin system VapC family toxin [Mesorhizobium sp. LHD-90]|uniref:type II toxin-antitoxin system VapC family toxin n=1 Tax=Mesorhizobium sp. LHD-90 TaxID=3071414 RepID=UPI0027E0BE85|nr:type II toxin-antitoxin system VapC family toxin [Mesorhizobium sp. LHD-90]MDQ6436674.1 type II toxin-antitoxin system VapC family toxin [Mesorhizobium sp. LHD-90]